MTRFVFASLVSVALFACGGETPSADDSETMDQADTASVEVTFPESLAAFGNGYPNDGDPCRRLGEGPATIDWLDDSATLVGCPSAETAASLGGTLMGEVEGITIISIQSGDANSEMVEVPIQSPVAKPEQTKPKEIGEKQLEKTCRAEVEKTTGAKVLGTISSDFSQAGTMFLFNVEGAQAPWQCIGYGNGTVGGVMFTGNEGAL